MIREDFLHYIWKYRLFDSEYFRYRDQKIEVIETGIHNLSSGPDFFNSKIRIGGTLWAGNVEIHVKASDWFRHRHEEDPAYDNIVLHVVYEPDISIYRKNGEEIPFVRLAFHPSLLKKYEKLTEKAEERLCYSYIDKLDRVYYRDWIGKLGFGRLERRVEEISENLRINQFDWDETLYLSIAYAMGANQNSEPFRMLAQSVPLRFIYKYRDNPESLNAAFFGQAGFLDETLTDDPYFGRLQKEYENLKKNLPEGLPGKHLWKLMRLRPAAFPVVRIPQLISLVRKGFPLMEKLTHTNTISVNDLIDYFLKSIDHYWVHHFLYGIPGRRPEFIPSKNTCTLWILNAVIPMLFSFGKLRNREEMKELAVDLLEELPAENNEILKKWNKFGVTAINAFDSQALIELKSRYCNQSRCTECMIGLKILSDAGSKR